MDTITSSFTQPVMTVGIMDSQREAEGRLDGLFYGNGFGPVSGKFSAKAGNDIITLIDEHNHEITRAPSIKLTAGEDSTFTLFQVTIGKQFHWERKENQTFQGNLLLVSRQEGTMAAINEIPLEAYLRSVISSEMSSAAPIEFLKAHAILSRSWLLAALERKKKRKTSAGVPPEQTLEKNNELTRWYEQEDHDLYDVCADDHCQRYQGITKIVSLHAEEAVRETSGKVIIYGDEICDARYSKACGGLTEEFGTAWADRRIPYLVCVPDAPSPYKPVNAEENAERWIFSEPEAYCNIQDTTILENILPDFDRETGRFFRWRIEYGREELEEILQEKSGFDFGTLKEIQPLDRGPSGRISRLKIIGSKRAIIVGKELEIRRWLSRSHLYSSAFIVTKTDDTSGEALTFTFHGAGWGHGVGLCQIGAAVMAEKGFTADEILRHYFTGVEIRKIY